MKSSPPDTAGDHALVQLVTQVLPVWMRHLAGARGQSETAVTQMLAAFGELTPLLSGERNPADRQACVDPIERMYQGFQFEDRVGQMMALLQQDMERLLQALADSDTSLDSHQWLARLEAGYVMTEQRQQHDGKSTASAAASSDDTTFF